VSVLDQHAVGADLGDLPGVGAEQEDVARQRLVTNSSSSVPTFRSVSAT